MVCGVATSVPPVMSRTPSTAPVSGSRIGAAEQLHGVTWRTRCSAPTICTGRPRASAVPGAFVPALASLQSAPGMKCIPSARVRSPRSPSTHSSCPAASLTATSRPASAALSTSSRRMIGMAAAKRVGGADLGQLGGVEPDLGPGVFRIEAAADAAPPRVDDDPAQCVVDLAGLDEVVVHLVEKARQGRCVGARRHRQAVALDHGPTIASGRAAPGGHDRMTA